MPVSCLRAGELRLLLVRGRLWEATCAALTAAAGQQPGVPKVLGFTPRRSLQGHTGPRSGSTPGSCSTTGSSMGRHSVGHTATATGPNAAVIDLGSLPEDMEYVPPAAGGPAGWQAVSGPDELQGDHSSGITAAAAAAGEQQVLELCGMCPVSVASSVAAGAAAAAAAGVSGLMGGGLQGQLLVGVMARTDCGMIRWAHGGSGAVGGCGDNMHAVEKGESGAGRRVRERTRSVGCWWHTWQRKFSQCDPCWHSAGFQDRIRSRGGVSVGKGVHVGLGGRGCLIP